MGTTVVRESHERRTYYSNQERRAQERHQEEQQRARAEQQRLHKAAEDSRQFWHAFENKFLPSVYDLAYKFFWLVALVITFAICAWVVSFLVKSYMERRKRQQEMEIQVQRMQHEESLKIQELEQKRCLKEKELRQDLMLKDKELDQEATLKLKELDQQKYVEERKYRLEMGKMYLEMYKEASKHGQLADLNSNVTKFTQNMLLADQPTAAVQDIVQLSEMAERSGRNTSLDAVGPQGQRQTSSVRMGASSKNRKPAASSWEPSLPARRNNRKPAASSWTGTSASWQSSSWESVW